jgi:hypothetical protein
LVLAAVDPVGGQAGIGDRRQLLQLTYMRAVIKMVAFPRLISTTVNDQASAEP